MDKEQRRRQIEHQFRETARKEVEGRTMGAKVWRQALEECDGDEELAREHYIKLRVLNLRVEFKRLAPRDLDLIMVPGVAFDREGGRTGHGKGYYDKLLEHARLETPLVALAFECQLFPQIPCESHDIYMDKVVTELSVYQGRGRSK